LGTTTGMVFSAVCPNRKMCRVAAASSFKVKSFANLSHIIVVCARPARVVCGQKPSHHFTSESWGVLSHIILSRGAACMFVRDLTQFICSNNTNKASGDTSPFSRRERLLEPNNDALRTTREMNHRERNEKDTAMHLLSK
jgi:hypothetical protein